MGPPKPKSKQQAMPSMLKSMQRSVTVASAAVDTALSGAGTSTGVGQRSSVVVASAAGAQERHSLLANDGMMPMDAASPDRPGSMGLGINMSSSEPAPKAPKLMKMNSRHIRMKKMMDSIGTRLKLHARGDSIAFGRRDRGDASGKSYNVEIPKNMIVLTLIAFFVMPLAFGLWVLFRQLFMSEETHSRYGHHPHHPHQHHSSSEFRASHHPDAFHVTGGGNGTAAEAATATEAAAVDSMGNATVSDGLVDQLIAEEKGDSAALATAKTLIEGEANKEEEAQDIKASISGDQDDAPKATGDNAVAEKGNVETESEESDVNDAEKDLSSGEKEDAADEAKVTKEKAEPPDSDDQEEEDDDSNVSEAEEGGAGGNADTDADADKDSVTEEGLPGSNKDKKGGTEETKDNADLVEEESEGKESLEKEEGGESSA